MTKVLIFDLDDTLYDESQFVSGGFEAVARFGEERFGWRGRTSLNELYAIQRQFGRGAVFDTWLRRHDSYSQRLVRECVRRYRFHEPKLSLFPEARRVLAQLATQPLFLLTDGHKLVQQRKIAALGIESRFRRVYVTHRFGVRHAKPSLYCFDRIRSSMRRDWHDLAYIGDNPAKDFVGLNRVGAITIRVLTGQHRTVEARPGFDAKYTIPDLGKLMALLKRIH